MENKILKISSVILTITILAAAAVMGNFSGYLKAETTKGGEKEHMQAAKPQKVQQETVLAGEDSETADFQQQLSLELPQGMTLDDVEIENDYVAQTIFIQIPDVEKDYFSKHPLLGSSSHINDLYMENGRIEITMDGVYELDSSVINGCLYLDFRTPQETYDKVVVIDAGHGGGAPGAVKQGIMEKDVNLAIVKELKALLDQNDQNIGAYYTRTEDVNPSFEQRVQLVEKTGANLFLSIHSNSSDNGEMSEYNGTEVMYDQEKSQQGLSGKHLAEICLEEATAAMGSKNNGVTHGNSIYVIRNSQVPAALIEVGFLTNQEELEKLASPDYQKKAAQGIYNAILRAVEEGY